MTKTIRLQGDSNAHDRPWKVAVEQGFFAAEGSMSNSTRTTRRASPGGWRISPSAGRNCSCRSRRARSLSGVRMGRDRARAAARQGQDHRARHHRAHRRHHGAQGFQDHEISSSFANVPIAVTWHAGTFYAAIEALEAAGVPFNEIKLEHANDRLDALLSGRNEAAALMEPLVSRAASAGCRKLCDLSWRGGIVAGDESTTRPRQRLTRALNRAIEWLRANEERSREELLRDLTPEQRKTGMMPELHRRTELQGERIPGEGRLDGGARLLEGQAAIRRGRAGEVIRPHSQPSFRNWLLLPLRHDRAGSVGAQRSISACANRSARPASSASPRSRRARSAPLISGRSIALTITAVDLVDDVARQLRRARQREPGHRYEILVARVRGRSERPADTASGWPTSPPARRAVPAAHMLGDGSPGQHARLHVARDEVDDRLRAAFVGDVIELDVLQRRQIFGIPVAHGAEPRRHIVGAGRALARMGEKFLDRS